MGGDVDWFTIGTATFYRYHCRASGEISDLPVYKLAEKLTVITLKSSNLAGFWINEEH